MFSVQATPQDALSPQPIPFILESYFNRPQSGGGEKEQMSIKRGRGNQYYPYVYIPKPNEEQQARQNIQSQLAREQQARQNIQSQLATEQQARQNIQSQLAREQQASQNIQSQLAREQQARQNIQSQLAREQQARQNIQSQLATEHQTRRNIQSQLDEEQQARQNIQSQLDEEQQARQNIQSQLATEQQARQNIQSQLAREQQARQNIQSQLAREEQTRQNIQSQLATEQQTRRNIQSQLDEEQQARQNIQSQLDEEQQARQNIQSQRDVERQAMQLIQVQLAREQLGNQRTILSMDWQLNTERQRREAAEQRTNELQANCEEIQANCNELQARCDELLLQQSRDWILAREEVSLFEDRSIGRGAWGEVLEGTFRGCTVAVKRIHQLILSDHNRRLFEREMYMASRCRHPCLLQFIGATADDAASPLFVTELLETSLRAVLHGRALEPLETLTLIFDVARGLNYLHLNRPDPIIHRDISSGNVLLWRQNNSWRAKVSDYGTANFIRRCATVSPGAPIYSAPEAIDFTRQTTKIDVYSFGVLLCEMHIREQPDPLERNSQVSRVSNRCHRTLIQRCLLPNPNDRPSMGEVIDILERSRDDPLPINETS